MKVLSWPSGSLFILCYNFSSINVLIRLRKAIMTAGSIMVATTHLATVFFILCLTILSMPAYFIHENLTEQAFIPVYNTCTL